MKPKIEPALPYGPQPARVPLPVMLFVVFTVMVPIELGFYVGPLFFTWAKAFLVVMTPFVLLQAMTRLRLRAFDWVIMAHGLWFASCLLRNQGFPKGIEAFGTFILETIIVYLMMRVYLRSVEQVRATIRLLFVMVAILAIAAVPEAVLKTRYIHDIASAITGLSYNFSPMERLGFLRAATFFEHPILHGMFCASIFSLVWFNAEVPAKRLAKAGVVAFGTFWGLSSAPLLTLVAQMGLIVVERATRWLPMRVPVLAFGALGMILFLEFGTGRGTIGVLTLFTLSAGTAWARVIQWDHAVDDVMAHAFFGAEEWTRPSWLSASIDNHWLAMAMRGGLPSLILIALALFLIWRAMFRDTTPVNSREPFYRLRTGWCIMMLGLILGGATVTYFGRMLPLFFFFTAIGGVLAALVNTQAAQSPAGAGRSAHHPSPRARPILSRLGTTDPAGSW